MFTAISTNTSLTLTTTSTLSINNQRSVNTTASTLNSQNKSSKETITPESLNLYDINSPIDLSSTSRTGANLQGKDLRNAQTTKHTRDTEEPESNQQNRNLLPPKIAITHSHAATPQPDQVLFFTGLQHFVLNKPLPVLKTLLVKHFLRRWITI